MKRSQEWRTRHSDSTPPSVGPLRIALIAPLYESVPPSRYGGTERVVATLADALVDEGHDVTVFASGDSLTRANLVPCRERAIRLDPAVLKADVPAHLAMLHEVRRRADAFDVLHFHVDVLHFPLFEALAGRTLTTLHGRLDIADLHPAYRRWPQFPLVSISDSQRAPMPWASWVGTVHHGLAPDRLRFSPRGEGYVAFLGRISPEKRPDRAIEIARRAGRRIVIAAKVDAADARYFREVIEPLLRDPDVEYIGEVDDVQKSVVLGGAEALLFPIDWPEPFGLVMIEAMACGVPVIAWNLGSVPEVIDEGQTGFVVDSIDEAVEALRRVPALDRARIREVFERRFSASAMATRYVALYCEAAREGRRASRSASGARQAEENLAWNRTTIPSPGRRSASTR